MSSGPALERSDESSDSDNPGSVSGWIRETRQGDSDAAALLLQRYMRELETYARRLLPKGVRTLADEEDVAIEALGALLQGLRKNRFPYLKDRDDLWCMLVMITRRGASNLVKSETREKRDRQRTVAADADEGMFAHAGKETDDPAWIAQFHEMCRRLFGALPTPEARKIALMRMAGHTVAEIAAEGGRSERAIERKLESIRTTWRQYLE